MIQNLTDLKVNIMPINNRPPPRLYKYRPLNTNSKEDLKRIKQLFEGNAFFSSPLNFNDPIDSLVPINILDLSTQEKDYYLKQLAERGFNVTEQHKKNYHSNNMILSDLEIRKQLLEKYSVYSLSANKRDWLMWTYYADGHNGIVVGFDTSKFFIGKIFEMNYKTRIPHTKIIDDDLARMETSLLTKSKTYSHEDEYRVILHDQPSALQSFDKGSICEIILGYKTSKKAEKIIKNLIEKNSISAMIYKIDLPSKPNQEFELIVKEYIL